jgi:hypothetical protein
MDLSNNTQGRTRSVDQEPKGRGMQATNQGTDQPKVPDRYRGHVLTSTQDLEILAQDAEAVSLAGKASRAIIPSDSGSLPDWRAGPRDGKLATDSKSFTTGFYTVKDDAFSRHTPTRNSLSQNAHGAISLKIEEPTRKPETGFGAAIKAIFMTPPAASFVVAHINISPPQAIDQTNNPLTVKSTDGRAYQLKLSVAIPREFKSGLERLAQPENGRDFKAALCGLLDFLSDNRSLLPTTLGLLPDNLFAACLPGKSTPSTTPVRPWNSLTQGEKSLILESFKVV